MNAADQSFNGRIAVITGASRGIGAALAVRLGAAGAQCVLIARTVGGLETTDDAIRKAGGSPATLVPLDLSKDHDSIDLLGAELFARHGRVDLLIGNAAQLGTLSPVGHITPQTWQETFALNVTANYRLLRSFDPLLRQSPAGHAVFITCAVPLEPFWSVYAASKAALEKLVACYAAELQKTTVRARCFDPGPAATKLHRTAFPGMKDADLPTADQAAAALFNKL